MPFVRKCQQRVLCETLECLKILVFKSNMHRNVVFLFFQVESGAIMGTLNIYFYLGPFYFLTVADTEE